MQVRKNTLLKLGLSIVLLGGLAVLLIPAMTGTAGATSLVSALPQVTCVVGTPCTASTPPVIGGGSLTGSTNPPVINNGAGITLDGDQYIPFRFQSSVKDTRGTGVGWTLSSSATPLTFSNGVTSDYILDSDVPVTITCAGTCSNPAALTLAAPGSDLATAPVALVTAGTGTGLGAYTVLATGNFLVPSTAGAGATTGGAVTVTLSTP